MSGTIRPRVTKTGKKRYDVIFRDQTRKQRWKTFDRRKDADDYLTEQRERVRTHAYRKVEPLLMSELLDRWLTDELEVRLKMGDDMKAGTAATYRSIVNRHLVPAFGEYRSDNLRGAVGCVAAMTRTST